MNGVGGGMQGSGRDVWVAGKGRITRNHTCRRREWVGKVHGYGENKDTLARRLIQANPLKSGKDVLISPRSPAWTRKLQNQSIKNLAGIDILTITDKKADVGRRGVPIDEWISVVSNLIECFVTFVMGVRNPRGI